MAKIYYIADCHLFHDNVIKFDNRPFNTIEDMNKTIIDNWNARVQKNDHVYILGDFIWKKRSAWPEIINSLKGRKTLIIGNHDPREYSLEIKKCFDGITDYKEISESNKKIILCHYPIPFHKHDNREDYYMLYGHVHNSREFEYLKQLRKEIRKRSFQKEGRPLGNFINVGCMMPWMDYTPRTLGEIIAGDDEYYKKETESSCII